MSIETRTVKDVTILDVKGKVTIGEGDVTLRESIRSALADGAKKILLDLSGVTTIDSSGIGELVSSYTATTNQGGKLKLTNLPPKVHDILMITQLITVFETYDSETEALQSF
ncbi:MAG: STAS domain-containing protein [Nostoc sp. DedQUE08]|uniref:STAS domain-containing protein n=1 Tax=unclassified Nostoc TaxID=2593658 RepID=UPI002AD2A7AF|nr:MULTISPECIES: STAS domain-containing protein [unclassified Nostoc]MDZ8070535.1 STAS domain-containing protein [Nostoc sp. DedQUE08]MDZ8093536.1 STAS domain-containing protein [Nostoc sp. DedQUE05]MDZ8133399.1 STAS domain-containing protein [Nostoc sp. DedQUE07]